MSLKHPHVSDGDGHDPDNAARRTELLKGAFAEGIDLGSRSAHIKELGRSIEASLDELRQKCAALESEFGLQNPDLFILHSKWQILIQKLEIVVTIIHGYQTSNQSEI